MPTTVNLQQPNTTNDEENYAGNGTLGPFTFRYVRAIDTFSATAQHLLGPK